MSEIKMYIANEEVVSNQNFTIKEEILSASSTILNNCYPKTWEDTKDYVSNFYYPKDYSACKILKDNELIFAGIVKNSGSISLNPRYPHYCSLQILDYKTLLSEGKTLDFVISEKTIKQAIELVTSAIADYGFEVGVINIANANDIIGAYSTLNQTAYDVYQYLSEISGARWFTRRIDENKIAIDFYDPQNIPKADNILYTTEYFENNNIVDINFNYGTRDYRNKQTILSDQVYSSILTNDVLTSDGYSTNYITSQSIGVMSSIKVSREEKTFATKDITYTINYGKQYSYNYGISMTNHGNSETEGIKSDNCRIDPYYNYHNNPHYAGELAGFTFNQVNVNDADTDSLYLAVSKKSGRDVSILPVPDGVLSALDIEEIKARRSVKIGGIVNFTKDF